MFPSTLLPEDVKSDGERKVFEELDRQLADEWVVFHTVSWGEQIMSPAEQIEAARRETPGRLGDAEPEAAAGA